MIFDIERTLSDTKHRWPARLVGVPATVDVVQLLSMLEVCSVDSKLIKRV